LRDCAVAVAVAVLAVFCFLFPLLVFILVVCARCACCGMRVLLVLLVPVVVVAVVIAVMVMVKIFLIVVPALQFFFASVNPPCASDRGGGTAYPRHDLGAIPPKPAGDVGNSRSVVRALSAHCHASLS